MRPRLAVLFLATLGLACGGRATQPIAAEPLDRPAATQARTVTPPETPVAPRAGEPGRNRAGIHHVLERGQTLYSLARLYDVPLPTLMSVNGITDPTAIRAGASIFVPGASRRLEYRPAAAGGDDAIATRDGGASGSPSGVREMGIAGLSPGDEDEVDHGGPPGDERELERRAANALAWPLHGAITGAYGRRGKNGHHSGIDIDGQQGDPIRAAASGVVLEAGPDGPYGRRIVIDHGDGLSTLYAHAERLLVRPGETVHVGQRIALVGRSGNARGTHLHFEVRHGGRTVDPVRYLDGDLLTAGVN